MTETTGFSALEPKLEETFAMFGVLETITHDNGPPYQSGDWKRFAKKHGFEKRPTTPGHPEGNGLAERFMSVLVKTIRTARAEGQDPRQAVKRRLLNYWNTPHPSTGVPLAELMFRRRIRTRIPVTRKLLPKSQLEEEGNETLTLGRKEKGNSIKIKTMEIEMRSGDKVLVHSDKKSLSNDPVFNRRHYTVVKKKKRSSYDGKRWKGKEKKQE